TPENGPIPAETCDAVRVGAGLAVIARTSPNGVAVSGSVWVCAGRSATAANPAPTLDSALANGIFDARRAVTGGSAAHADNFAGNKLLNCLRQAIALTRTELLTQAPVRNPLVLRRLAQYGQYTVLGAGHDGLCRRVADDLRPPGLRLSARL